MSSSAFQLVFASSCPSTLVQHVISQLRTSAKLNVQVLDPSATPSATSSITRWMSSAPSRMASVLSNRWQSSAPTSPASPTSPTSPASSTLSDDSSSDTPLTSSSSLRKRRTGPPALSIPTQGTVYTRVCAPSSVLKLTAKELDMPSTDEFSFSQRQQLVWALLTKVEMDDDFRMLVERDTPLRVSRQLRQYAGADKSLVRNCLSLGLISDCMPIHDEKLKAATWKRVLHSWFLLPCEPFHSYYGEQVAFYFAFMNHYTMWLLIPAVFALLIEFLNSQNPLVPLYSLLMPIWAVLCLKFWRRRNASLALDWGCIDLDRHATPRADYYGDPSTDPITGKPNRYYPSSRRYPKQIISAAVTLAMLGIGVLAMLASLNLQGYMGPADGVLYVEWLSRLSRRGHLFDAHVDGMLFSSSDYLFGLGWLIPIVGHSVFIGSLDSLYQRVAERLTLWENYRTDVQHESALVFRRVLFGALDCYLPLFFLAFYKRQMDSLESYLSGLYTADEVRRLSVESVLPYFISRLTRTREYSQFEDWMEVIIQFGYVCLFASAFPLGSLLAFFSNLLEMRSDAFKLTFNCRLPRSVRVSGIGTWGHVLYCTSFLAVITNCFLSTEQMRVVFPALFDEDSSGGVILVFLIEHCIEVIVLLIFFLIPDRPYRVRLALRRREYQNELIKKIHLKRFRRQRRLN